MSEGAVYGIGAAGHDEFVLDSKAENKFNMAAGVTSFAGS
jgi:hypothetical protein